MRGLFGMSRIFAFVLGLLAVVVAGCAGPDSVAPTATSTPVVTTTASSVQSSASGTFSPPDVTPACPTWNEEKKESNDAPSTQNAISHVDVVAKNPCYDSVTFIITGEAKSASNSVWYSADWVPTLVTDPKGDTIPVNGGAILQLVIHAPTKGYEPTGPSADRMAAVGDRVGQNVGRAVTEVRFVGSSEGQSNYGVVLDHRRPYNVTASSADGFTTVVMTVAMG